jgi:hypothetical protein
MKTFGELIAEGRKRVKLTQGELAARIRWKTDGRCRPPTSSTSNTTFASRLVVFVIGRREPVNPCAISFRGPSAQRRYEPNAVRDFDLCERG